MPDIRHEFDTLRGLLTAIALLAVAVPCAAQDDDEGVLSGGFAIGSDLTFRGVSQTMGEFAIEGSLDLSLPSGIYAYAWASNVDFAPAGEPDDGATHEVDLAVGYATGIGENWDVDISLVRYLFPGTVDGVDYDFNEIMATAGYGGTYRGTVAYSSNVDGSGGESLYYELGADLGLREDTVLELSIGHYDLADAYDDAYSFAEVALRHSFANTEVVLSYTDTSDSAEAIYFRQSTGRRFIVSLHLSW